MDFHPGKKRYRETDRTSGDASAAGTSPLEHGHGKRARPSTSATPATAQYIVIHRVECTQMGNYHDRHEPTADYFDVPRLLAGANRKTALQGRQRLLDVESYLEDHSGLSFAVYVTYSCEKYHDDVKDAFQRLPMPSMDSLVAAQAKPYFYILQQDGWSAAAGSEALILSDGLREALHALNMGSSGSLRDWDVPQNMRYPFLQLYHYRKFLTGHVAESLDLPHQIHLEAFAGYLDLHLTPDFAEAQTLFEQGSVSKKHWAKLFRPDEVVVTFENGQPVAFVLISCPLPSDNHLVLRCWSWGFDGSFFRSEVQLRVPWPTRNDVAAVTELQVYPLRYAEGGLEGKLRSRGERFWGCRGRKYVNYDVPLQGMEIQIANLRYMLDMKTYKLMHGNEEAAPERDELDDEVMRGEGIPPEPFALLLPATIRGFGLHNKKWSTLLVEHIRDIKWNKDIFDHRLVLQEEKKELIRALITVHIGKTNAIRTDFMEGKGEGLIILLHGGPGTGKTLTAESIAEHAQRPLYRVTCGDIGTDPEGVEKYLDSVLFIGSTWGCVVLLDEADVFLEERTKMDLQRNALVSVFLRVLEYYDGILILTTNRIGTFDEAFKSRVQLALHYPKLNEEGRREVWYNFMQSLQEGGENINFDEINKKLHVLARHNLNGRQIRNTINTARQLARYKGETLRYVHVDQAVRVVDEFEKHITDVHGHSDEEYAREKGDR